mgnify:CR=1 FL=1
MYSFLNCYLVWNTGIGFGLVSMETNTHYHILTSIIVIVNIGLIFFLVKSKVIYSYFMALIIFPDPSYKMGPRAMPSHVPTLPDSSLEAQRLAREFFKTSDKPFLSVFAGDDPVTNGIESDVLEMAPNAKSAPNIDGGHFYQWHRPKELSELLINFIKEN